MVPELKKILDTFDHHSPNDSQIERIGFIREAAKRFACYIFDYCPSSADRTAALRKLHECMMTANKSIVLENE